MYFYNAIFRQNLGEHKSADSSLSCGNYQNILGENLSIVVSCCLLHVLDFKVFFLLNRLPSKARDPNLTCYLDYSKRGEKKRIQAFLGSISAEVNDTEDTGS